MRLKKNFTGMAVTASLFIMLAAGCASSPSTTQQPPTSYMRSAVGTPSELSPMAPGDARNLRKVGDHWACEVHGKTMIYNSATACWEPQ